MTSTLILKWMCRRFLRTGGCLLLFGASGSSLCASDAVVTFNELQYHPPDGPAEWIELHNQFSIRIELSGWRLSGGIDFVFPSGTVIEPKGFLVVAGEGEAGLPAGSLGPFSGRLDNAGETIRLRDLNDRVMDELSYGDTDPWPVVPDGSGATLSKRGPDFPTHRPESWTWSSAAGGTPGSANFLVVPPPGARGDVVLAEVSGSDEEAGVFGLELWNRGDSPVDLEGLRLLLLAGTPAEWIADAGTIAPGARFWVQRPWEDYDPDPGHRVVLADAGGNFLDGVNLQRRGRSRSNTGGDDWFVHDTPTPGEENAITLEENVVIHEIMYHFPPQYEDPAASIPFAENAEEWIELFNRGEAPVDLTGWSLGGGVDFAFAPGTVLDAGGYLVVSGDVAALQFKYPDIAVTGPLDGNLGNRSDLILLRDARGNQVDRVEYFDNGRWPRWADGGGSSLELRDPFADNALPEAWAASDESAKAEWVNIEYEGQAREPVRSNNPNQFHEFFMGLLSAGEVLVDDISVLENPGGGGIEFIQNGDFSRVDIFTGAASKWRILGTHANSRVENDPDAAGNKVLRLTATSRLEHSYNIASTTYANSERVDESAVYRISLRARWQRGSPQLNTRLYFNRLAKTHVLPIPDRLGTPGAANGAREDNIGPVFSEMRARPIVPEPNEAVRVEIAAGDPQGVDAAEIWFRPEGGVWATAPMTQAGVAGRFFGEIPGQPDGTLVQFFVRARDGQGAAADHPAGGAASRALYRVGDQRAGQRDVRVIRLLMLEEEHRFMRRAEHSVSNGRIGGTMVAGDDEVYYDVGIRLRSSPYGRQGNRAGFNVHFGRMHAYRGIHESIALDRAVVMANGNSNGFFHVGVGAGTNELVVNQIARAAGGIPISYDDVVFLEPPRAGEASYAQLRMSRFGANYLEDQYENGGGGALMKFELVYYPTRTIDGNPEGLKAAYGAVLGVDIQSLREDKEAYRYNYIPLNERDRDDYSGIIRLGEAFSSRTDGLLQAAIQEAMDVDQWMRVFAFESLIGVADTYNLGLEHNLLLYTRPEDGRVLAFPWDLDHAFYYTPRTLPLAGIGNTNLARVISLPGNTRLLYSHMHDICRQSYRTDYLGPWIDHLNAVTQQDFGARMRSYIDQRRDFVLSEINRQIPPVNFRITTNLGFDFETDESSVRLEGKGWVDLRSLLWEETGEILPVHWIGLDAWRTEIPLQSGSNLITLRALGFDGEPVSGESSDTIRVTNTGIVEAASAQNLALTEIFYHPADDQLPGGASDPDALEFLELRNVGARPVDLGGARFTAGLPYRFPDGSASIPIEPGEFVLLVRNRDVFEQVYGTALPVAGEYGDATDPDGGPKLSNGGERLMLEDRFGVTIFDFAYGDGLPWPPGADGGGYSITRRAPHGTGDPSDPSNWRDSVWRGGSPGSDDTENFTRWFAEMGASNPDGDPDGNGLTWFEEYALGADLAGGAAAVWPVLIDDGPADDSAARVMEYRYGLRSGADDLGAVVEWSADLATWIPLEEAESMRIVFQLLESDGLGRTIHRLGLAAVEGEIQTNSGYLRLYLKPWTAPQ